MSEMTMKHTPAGMLKEMEQDKAAHDIRMMDEEYSREAKGPAYGLEGKTVRQIIDEDNARKAKRNALKKKAGF